MAEASGEENQDKHIQQYANNVYAATPSSGSGGGEEEEQDEEKANAEQSRVRQMEEIYNYLQTPKEENIKDVSEWVTQASTFTAENPMKNDEIITDIKLEKTEQDNETREAEELAADDMKNEASEENLQEARENLQSTFKIFVSNLPPGLLNSELMELFQQHGEVAECEIFAKNYAFVHMISEDAGIKALEELNGLDLRGCKINVKRSVQSSHPVKKNPAKAKIKQEPEPPEPETKLEDLEVGTFKIYMGNLHSEVTKDYVSKLLEPFGRIVELEIYRTTSAFVHMETEEGGRKAMEELHGKILPESEDEKPLVVTESRNPEGPTLATIKLMVKNLAASVSPGELRDLFTPYGLVLKVSLSQKLFPKGSGCRTAIVHLEQFGNIRSAIKDLTGKEVGGSAISVEATFDKPKQEKYTNKPPPPFFNRPLQRPVLNKRDASEWTPVVPPSYPQHTDWAPPNRMRLIPMPSEAELHNFPGRGRGRRLLRPPPRGPLPPPLMGQHPFPTNNSQWGRQANFNYEGYDNYHNNNDGYNAEGYDNFNNEGYDNCNNQYQEGFNDGFGGGYSNANYEETEEFNEFEEYDWSQQSDGNEYAPPPMKIPRNQSRDTVRNFAGRPAGHQNGRSLGRGKQNNYNAKNVNSNNNSGRKGPFPQLPAPEQFPKVPKSLMSMQVSKPEDHDWSSDLPISSFSAFSSDQDFASDEPINNSLNAVSFDYSQMKRKKNFQNNSNNWQRNQNANNNGPQQAQMHGKGNKSGKGRKGKSARRPGLGSAQQQKKFSHQAGNDEHQQDSSTLPGEWQPVSSSSSTGTGGNSASDSSNAYAPYYFQQNWSFSKGKQNNKKPTAKQMKEAEEEQKRQYADYLKQKPWLYQAIPGTVKKVQQ